MSIPSLSNVGDTVISAQDVVNLKKGVRIWSIVFDQRTARGEGVLITEHGNNFKFLKAHRVSIHTMLQLTNYVSKFPDSGAFRVYINGALSVLIIKGVENDDAY